MAVGVSVLDIEAMMKTKYTKNKIQDMSFKMNPLFGTTKKMTDFGGDSMKIPVRYANNGSYSPSFAAAQGNQTAGGQVAFALTRGQTYSLYTVQGSTIRATRGNEEAFMREQALLMDQTWESLVRGFEIDGFRDGSGARACLDPTQNTLNSTTLWTLGTAVGTTANINGSPTNVFSVYDWHNLEIGQKVSFAYYSGGVWAYRSPGGNGGNTVFVTQNNGSGVIGFSTSYNPSGTNALTVLGGAGNPIPDLQLGDVIVLDGALSVGAPNSNQVVGTTQGTIYGLGAWLPFVAPTSTDSFFGVNRSPSPNRLAGNILISKGSPIEEVLQTLSATIRDQDGLPDTAWMSSRTFNQLQIQLGAKKTYSTVEAHDRADIGYRSIIVQTAAGDIDCMVSSGCPDQLIYMMESDRLTWNSLGEAPGMLNDDGVGSILRVVNADAYESRFGAYHQISIDGPGHCGVAQIR